METAYSDEDLYTLNYGKFTEDKLNYLREDYKTGKNKEHEFMNECKRLLFEECDILIKNENRYMIQFFDYFIADHDSSGQNVGTKMNCTTIAIDNCGDFVVGEMPYSSNLFDGTGTFCPPIITASYHTFSTFNKALPNLFIDIIKKTNCNFYFDEARYESENAKFDKKESVSWCDYHYANYHTHNISSYPERDENIIVSVLNFFTSFLSQIKKSSEKFDMIRKK